MWYVSTSEFPDWPRFEKTVHCEGDCGEEAQALAREVLSAFRYSPLREVRLLPDGRGRVTCIFHGKVSKFPGLMLPSLEGVA